MSVDHRTKRTLGRRIAAVMTAAASGLLLALPAPADAAVTFAEDFSGTALRSTVWTAQTSAINDICASTQNASVGGGMLSMVARRTSGSCPYTGARVLTKDKLYVGYGTTTARIDFNTRRGSWQGFVLFGKRSGGLALAAGEIDAAEISAGTLHYRLWSVRQNDATRRCGIPIDVPFGGLNDFHVYGVDHQPTYVRFLLDGRVRATITKSQMLNQGCTWPFDRTFHIVFSNRAGGWGGQPDPAQFPVTTRVDWVRHSS
jgi:beta-glucanase (GH16 family)